MAPPILVSKLLDPRMYPIRDPDFPAAQRPMEPTPEKVTQLLRVLKFVQGTPPSTTSLSSSNGLHDHGGPSKLEKYQHQYGNRSGALAILTTFAEKPLIESPYSSSSPSVTSPSTTTAFPAIDTGNKLMIRFVQELLQQPYRDNSQEEMGRGLTGSNPDSDDSRNFILDPFKISDESLGMQRNRRIQFNNDRDLLSRQFILSTADPYSSSVKSLRSHRMSSSGGSGDGQDEGQSESQQEDLEQDDDEEPTKFLLTLYPEQCPFQHPATIAAGGKRGVLKAMVQQAIENEIGAMQWIQQNCSRVLCTRILGFAHHGQSRSRSQILEGFGLLGCILVEFPKESILYQGPSKECRLTEHAHKHFTKQVAKMLYEMRKITKSQVLGFTVPVTAMKATVSGKRVSLQTQLQQMNTDDIASENPALKPLETRSRFDLVVDALRATDSIAAESTTSSTSFPSRSLSPSASHPAEPRPSFTGILRRKGRQLLSKGGRPLPHIDIDDPEAQHPFYRPKQAPNSPLRYMVRAADLLPTQDALSKDPSSNEEGCDGKEVMSTLSLAGSIKGSCSITLSKRVSATPSSTSVSSAFDRDMNVYCSRRSHKNSITEAGRIREVTHSPPPRVSRLASSQSQSSCSHIPSGKITVRTSTASLKQSNSLTTASPRSESPKARKSVIDLFHVGAWKKSPQEASSIVGKGKGRAVEECLPVGQPMKKLEYDDNGRLNDLNGSTSSRHVESFQGSVENSLTWPMEFITPKMNKSNGANSFIDPSHSVSMHEQTRLWNALVALERLDSAPGSNSRFPRALFDLLPRILALVHDEFLFVHSAVSPRRRTAVVQETEEVSNNDPTFRPQNIFEGTECVLTHGASLEPVSWMVASRQHHRKNGTVLAVLNWSHAGFLPDYEENLQAPFVEAAPSTFWHTGGSTRALAPPAVQVKPERNKLSSIAKRLSGSLRRSSSVLFGSKLSPPTDDEANRTGPDNGCGDLDDGPPNSDSSFSTVSLDYSTKYPAPWPIVNHIFSSDLAVPAKFMTFQQQDPQTPTPSACSCRETASSVPLSTGLNREAKITAFQSLRSKLKLGKGSIGAVANQQVYSQKPPSSMLSVDTAATNATFYISSSSPLSLPYLQRVNLLSGERSEGNDLYGTGSGSGGPPLRRGDIVPVSRRVHARSWNQFQQAFQHESRKASEITPTVSDSKGTSTISALSTDAPSTAAATLASPSFSVASNETLRPSISSSPSASGTPETIATSGGDNGSNGGDEENSDDAWMLRELESLDHFGESFIYDFEAPSSSSSPDPTTHSDDYQTTPSALTVSSDSSSSDYDYGNDNGDGANSTTDPSSTATASVLRALVSVSKTLQNMVILLESGATILTPIQLSEAIAARQEIAWDREKHRLRQIERTQENFKKLHREAAKRQAMEQEASLKSKQTLRTAAAAAATRSPRQVERPTLNHSLYTSPPGSSNEDVFGTASESSEIATGLRRRPSTASRRSRTSTKNNKKKNSPAIRTFKSIFQAWRPSRRSSLKNKKGDSSPVSTSSPPPRSSFNSSVSTSTSTTNGKGKGPSSRSYIPERSPEDDILYSAPGLQRDPLPSELPAHLFNLTLSANQKSDTACCHHSSPTSTGRMFPLPPTPSIVPLPPADCPIFGIRLTAEDERERDRLEREEQAFWKGLEGHWDQSLGSRTWEQQQAILATSGNLNQPSLSSFGNRPKVTNKVGGNGGGGIALLDLEQLEQCLNIVEEHVRKVEGEVASALCARFNKNSPPTS